MTILTDFETEKTLDIDYEKTALAVAEKALELENCPYEAQISLILTDDEGIRQVNSEFRDIDRSTDVLSFPMIPFESPAA